MRVFHGLRPVILCRNLSRRVPVFYCRSIGKINYLWFIKSDYYMATTFKDRLIVEETELDDKIYKLGKFMESDKFNAIDDVQKALLNVQLLAMQTYSQVLHQRIVRLQF